MHWAGLTDAAGARAWDRPSGASSSHHSLHAQLCTDRLLCAAAPSVTACTVLLHFIHSPPALHAQPSCTSGASKTSARRARRVPPRVLLEWGCGRSSTAVAAYCAERCKQQGSESTGVRAYPAGASSWGWQRPVRWLAYDGLHHIIPCRMRELTSVREMNSLQMRCM